MSLENQKNNKISLKPWQLVLIFLIALAVIGQFFSKGNSSENNSSSSSEITPWIPPAEFISWDSNLAYKWVENPQCDYGSVCAAIQVTSNIDCPNNLYAELTLQDKDYVQYDYTNQSQGSLFKGNTAELTFNFEPNERFAHFTISKISCV